MGQPPKPVVGSWVRTEQFAEHLTDLSQHVAVDALKVDAPASSAPVAFVLELDEADEETFKALRRIRHAHATTPVIALARTLDANLAVELIKLGVTDCVCLPAPAPVLWRKVERAVLRSGGPTLDSPLIALLWDADAYPPHEEKRRCFRSDTVADYPAYVTVVQPTTLPKMLVKNLSILTEGCPGGFALVGTNVHVHALKAGQPFRFVLAVPESTTPHTRSRSVASGPNRSAGSPPSSARRPARSSDPARRASTCATVKIAPCTRHGSRSVASSLACPRLPHQPTYRRPSLVTAESFRRGKTRRGREPFRRPNSA
jgi:hypothetical protein